MRIDSTTMITICGMAVATYATRAGGMLLMRRVGMSSSVERWLRYVPRAVLVALVAPTIANGGVATMLAALATAAVAVRTRSLVLAMLAGVGVVWLLRLWV